MFIRQQFKTVAGKRRAYWALVESVRTERGPRQKVVSWLGALDEAGRLGMLQAARNRDHPPSLKQDQSGQLSLFEYDDEPAEPKWIEVDSKAVRVENCRQFGDPWLALKLIEELKLDEFLNKSLEIHLKNRMGELFGIEYDLLLYDVTSTFFEGQCLRNPMAKRGYSRDQRSDCKQVCIALVVTKCGIPLGYEVFAGNTVDVTTIKSIVEKMETRYGKSDRIWVMDRGMTSESNLEFLRQENRRYIIGTNKALLKKFEQELLKENWHTIREGIEVKLCKMPKDEDQDESEQVEEVVETFILCRSESRKEKDRAIVQRAADKIADRLASMKLRCEKQNRDKLKVSREIGRLLGQNTRASHLFDVQVKDKDTDKKYALIEWTRIKPATDWHELSDGCYLLRTNVRDWSDEELWKAYIQLTEAENAFRIHKSDLSIRPVWHQKEDRVLAHIFVCFLSYVLWKTLGRLCHKSGLGDEPRRVISELRLVDVVLPTRDGREIRTSCVSRPTDHQKILLERLGFRLPSRIRSRQM